MDLVQGSLFYQDGFFRRNNPLSLFRVSGRLRCMSTARRLALEAFCFPLNHT